MKREKHIEIPNSFIVSQKQIIFTASTEKDQKTPKKAKLRSQKLVRYQTASKKKIISTASTEKDQKTPKKAKLRSQKLLRYQTASIISTASTEKSEINQHKVPKNRNTGHRQCPEHYTHHPNKAEEAFFCVFSLFSLFCQVT